MDFPTHHLEKDRYESAVRVEEAHNVKRESLEIDFVGTVLNYVSDSDRTMPD